MISILLCPLSLLAHPLQPFAAEWGQQVRNYILHPYKLVKDTRSGYESAAVEKVLDGDLDDLLTAYLHWAAVQGASELTD